MQEENRLDPTHMKFSYEAAKKYIGRKDKYLKNQQAKFNAVITRIGL